LFAWGPSQQFEQTQVTLSLLGLEENARYTEAVSGTTFHGAYLAHHGLPVSLVGDFDSHMIHLVREAPSR
jgi:hypothetical protein